MTNATGDQTTELPPIVLLVEDDRDMLDLYSTYFELDGVWMATAVSPDEGLGAVEELRPDVVITDIAFGGHNEGVDFVQMLKERPETRGIPLIVLTGLPAADLPPATRHGADIFLRKPVPADALLLNVRRLLESSATLRARGDRALARAKPLLQKSEDLRQRSRGIGARAETVLSRCPQCREPLEWVERATLAGHEYDYYRRCLRGCGLHCFDRTAHVWVKLT
jgi:CheY-like chemotaxis protein